MKSKKRWRRPIQRVTDQHDQRERGPGDDIGNRLDRDDHARRPDLSHSATVTRIDSSTR